MIIKRYGLDIAKKIRIFELETVLALKKLIKDHGWEKKVELREGGTVHSYLTDLEFNEAIENIEEMRNQGLGHELLIWDRLETVKVYIYVYLFIIKIFIYLYYLKKKKKKKKINLL